MYKNRYKNENQITDKQKVIAAVSVVLVVALLVAVWIEFIRKPRVKITFDPLNGGSGPPRTWIESRSVALRSA